MVVVVVMLLLLLVGEKQKMQKAGHEECAKKGSLLNILFRYRNSEFRRMLFEVFFWMQIEHQVKLKDFFGGPKEMKI